MTERTLVLVKPDAVRRRLIGEVIARVERKGLDITRCELRTISRDLAEEHYAEHTGKPFFPGLVEFITSGPLVAMVVEGEDAVTAVRQIMGATNPLEAAPGSIRAEYATAIGENLVHGSDSPENGAREVKLFFPDA
jgi:nucleoside-diphosphate kinase